MDEENKEVEAPGNGHNKLVVFTLKGIVDSYLAGVCKLRGSGEITMQYASMLALGSDATGIQVTPAIMPLGLIGDSFGRDAFTCINTEDALTTTYIDLIKDSPHKFVRQFVEFWGEEVLD